jgi:hypothetical protein
MTPPMTAPCRDLLFARGLLADVLDSSLGVSEPLLLETGLDSASAEAGLLVSGD